MSPLSWFRNRLAAHRELRAWLAEERREHPPRPLCCPQPLVDREGRVLPDPEHDLYERAGYGLHPMNLGPTAAAHGARTTPAGRSSARPSNPGRHGVPPTSVPTGPTRRDWS